MWLTVDLLSLQSVKFNYKMIESYPVELKQAFDILFCDHCSYLSCPHAIVSDYLKQPWEVLQMLNEQLSTMRYGIRYTFNTTIQTYIYYRCKFTAALPDDRFHLYSNINLWLKMWGQCFRSVICQRNRVEW